MQQKLELELEKNKNSKYILKETNKKNISKLDN